MIKKVFSLLFLLSAFFASAQDNISAPQMADAFRNDGKIWVVITVIGIIFISLVIFLICPVVLVPIISINRSFKKFYIKMKI